MSKTNKENKMHLVTQGKGGAGKTFVSSILCQSYLRANKQYQAFDLDPVNRSLAAISGLNAKPWEILHDNSDVNPKSFDDLVEVIYKADNDCILDLGATSFLPINNYLIRNRILELLRSAGMSTIIHCPIRGGSSLLECLNGLKKLCKYHSADDAKIVVWLNEVEGEIARDGKTFEQMKIYAETKKRISKIVTLPEQTDYLHRHDLLEMLKSNQMFDVALRSNKTGLVSKMRIENLKKVFCDLADRAIDRVA